jgi:hypothetical protein
MDRPERDMLAVMAAESYTPAGGAAIPGSAIIQGADGAFAGAF